MTHIAILEQSGHRHGRDAGGAQRPPNAIAAWIRAALSLDLTPELRLITAPTTVIIPFNADIDPYQGFPSKSVKQGAYLRWISHAPHGSVVVIDDSRHFVMFDQPAQFEAALETVLSHQGA
jgi:pimeloyl-ACP methyl ester carboxylesterase